MKRTHQRKIHLFLALVFIIQSLVCPVYAIAEGIQDQNMPIQGVPQVDTPNFDVEQSILESESEGDFSSNERESVTEIIAGEEEDESPSSDTENPVEETPAEEMPENQEEQQEEQEESEEDSLPSDLSQEQQLFLENLQPGQAKIYTSPKSSYRFGETVDLSGIEILAKTYDGQAVLFTLDDLENNSEISVFPRHGQGIPAEYFADFLDDDYLEDEAESFIEKVRFYLDEEKITYEKPGLTIHIPGYSPLAIDLDLTLEGSDIEPIQLFNALMADNSSVMVLHTDKLTYTYDEELNLDDLRLLLKDDDGGLSLVEGRDMDTDPAIHIHQDEYDAIIEQIRLAKEAERDQEIFSEEDSEEQQENPEENHSEGKFDQPIETHIAIDVDGYDTAYLPISLVSEDRAIFALDQFENAAVRTSGKIIDEDKAEFTVILDLSKLSEIKEMEFHFLDNSNHSDKKIQLTKIIKSDGNSEEDITLTDPAFRAITEDMDFYKDMEVAELAEALEDLDIVNPVDPARKLEAGYKYIFTVEMETELDSSQDGMMRAASIKEDADQSTPELLIEATTRMKDDIFDENTPDDEKRVETEIIVKAEEPGEDKGMALQRVEEATAIPAEAGDFYGKFEINKVDEEGQALSGAEFTLTKPDGTTEAKESDDDGKISFEELESGTYTLEESAAPDGYQGSDKTWTITVDANGVTRVKENQSATEAAKAIKDSVNTLKDIIKPRELPAGTKSYDVHIENPIPYEIDAATITTSAEFIEADQEFEITVDITAKEDMGKEDVDVVIVASGRVFKFHDDIKETLVNKINSYGDNIRVGLVTYDSTSGPRFSVPLTEKSNISVITNAISDYDLGANTWPSTDNIAKAFVKAKEILYADGVGRKKEVIHLTDSAPLSENNAMKSAVESIGAQNIRNYFLGDKIQSYIERWYSVGMISVVDASGHDVAILEETLPWYRGQAKVHLNDTHFEYVEGTLSNEKFAYNSGTKAIEAVDGELTLSAGETTTITFRVKATDYVMVDRDEPYLLMVGTMLIPNDDSGYYLTDPPPTVKVDGKFTDLTIETIYTPGPIPEEVTNPTINYTLKRKVIKEVDGEVQEIVDEGFERTINLGLDAEVEYTSWLYRKDDEGNLYTYYLEDVTSNDEKVKIVNIENNGVSGISGTITIQAGENIGFIVNVNWGELTPTGTITGRLEDGSEITITAPDTSHRDFSPEADSKKLVSATGPEGYTYTVTDPEEGTNAYTINVTKIEDTPIITVENKKIVGHFQIKKVDEEDYSIVLEGAEFTLTPVDDAGVLIEESSKTIATGEDGIAKFEKLEPGEYELRETTPPTGYVNSVKVWKVVVEVDGGVANVTVEERVPGVPETVINSTINNPQYSKGIKDYTGNSVVNFYNEIKEEDDKYYLYINFIKLSNYQWQDSLNIQFNTDDFIVLENGVEKENRVETFYPYHNQKYWDYDYGYYYDEGFYKYEISFRDQDFEGETRTISPIKSFKYEGNELGYNYYPRIVQEKSLGETLEPTIEEVELTGENNEFSVTNELSSTRLKIHKKDGLALDKPLPGVEFTLTEIDENDDPIDGGKQFVNITDAAGNIEFTKVPDGRYKLEETKSIEGYNDILIEFIIKVEDGQVSYTRKLKDDIDMDPSRVRTTSTHGVTYNVEFLPKSGLEVPPYSIGLYTPDSADVLESQEGTTDNHTGTFTRDEAGDYYVKFYFDNPADAENWEVSYTSLSNDKIQIILYKKGAYQDLEEGQDIQIRNFPEQKGQGELHLLKKDSKTGDPLQGVEFNIKASNGYNKNFTTDDNGQITVTELPNGLYVVTEVAAPAGYIVDKTPRPIIVGGSYSVPPNVVGIDVTNRVHFKEDTQLKVSNHDGEQLDPQRVQPNNSEGFSITSKYTFDPDIEPGDFFYLYLSENMNTWGVYVSEKSSDFYLAGPLGLLATGEYDEEKHAIKYTFTDHLDSQYPETASSLVNYFVEPTKITDNSSSVPIYTSLGNGVGAEKKGHTIQVVYGPTSYSGFYGTPGGYNSANSASRLVEVDWKTNSYKQIIYVNRYGNPLNNALLHFGQAADRSTASHINITEDDSVQVYKVIGTDIEKLCPNPMAWTTPYWRSRRSNLRIGILFVSSIRMFKRTAEK